MEDSPGGGMAAGHLALLGAAVATPIFWSASGSVGYGGSQIHARQASMARESGGGVLFVTDANGTRQFLCKKASGRLYYSPTNCTDAAEAAGPCPDGSSDCLSGPCPDGTASCLPSPNLCRGPDGKTYLGNGDCLPPYSDVPTKPSIPVKGLMQCSQQPTAPHPPGRPPSGGPAPRPRAGGPTEPGRPAKNGPGAFVKASYIENRGIIANKKAIKRMFSPKNYYDSSTSSNNSGGNGNDSSSSESADAFTRAYDDSTENNRIGRYMGALPQADQGPLSFPNSTKILRGHKKAYPHFAMKRE